jgi:hypothetical protein
MVRVLAYLSTIHPTISFTQAEPIIRHEIAQAPGTVQRNTSSWLLPAPGHPRPHPYF